MLKFAPGALVLGFGALIGLIAALADYFMKASGVAYSPGALLVVLSSLALLIAAAILASAWGRHGWVSVTLLVLSALGIIGTAFAAYLLESMWLEVGMVVCFLGWVGQAFWRRPARSLSSSAEAEPAQ